MNWAKHIAELQFTLGTMYNQRIQLVYSMDGL